MATIIKAKFNKAEETRTFTNSKAKNSYGHTDFLVKIIKFLCFLRNVAPQGIFLTLENTRTPITCQNKR